MKQRIVEVEQAIEQIGPELAQASLRKALNRPADGDSEILQRQRDLVSQLDRLRLALEVAERNEADRLALQRYSADVSRQRAASQKSAALQRATLKASSALAALQSAMDNMCSTGRDLHSLLPSPMRNYGWESNGPLAPAGFLLIPKIPDNHKQQGCPCDPVLLAGVAAHRASRPGVYPRVNNH